MRKLKRLLSAAMALCLMLSLIPSVALADEGTVVEYAENVTGGNIYFDTATGTVTDCDTSVTAADIPSTINNVSVTSIGGSAFAGCGSLTSITIPDSVTSIGNYTFDSCSSLTSITIPNSVTSIGYGAFQYCSSLTSITIPNGVTSIGSGAFSGCSSLTSITIPNSVTSIGSSAFSGCSSLTSITIFDGVTSIGDYAFYNCSSLTSITIPNSVTSIGSSAFNQCSSLTSVTIFDGVTSIGEKAFYGCTGLTSIKISNSVTSIGSGAFSNCYSLTSITIPSSVASIGSSAFYNCSSLKSITVDTANSNYCSVDGVLFDKSITTVICYPPAKKTDTLYIIPDSVISIADYAFYNCTNLTSITIPDSVTSIGNSAFSGCSSLTSITIPNSVTSIGSNAFRECTSLASIILPNAVASIGENMFFYCSKLKNITIPDSVTSIGRYAFYYCNSLTSINIPDSVTSIGESAFYYCNSLTSINIPDSVTSIGYEAFYYCSSLTDVYYSGTENKWNAIAIANNNDPLTLATIHYNSPGDVNTIVPCAVTGGNLYFNLTTGTIVDCDESVTEVKIPNTILDVDVTSVDDGVFRNCSSLKSINIPDFMTIINGNTFDNCISLTNITVDEENANYCSVDGVIFNKDKSSVILYPAGKTDTTYTIPDGVTSIETKAFYNCSNLTSVTIPDSVTSIGDEAFGNCSNLTSVTIPSSVTSIGGGVFMDCTSLTNITIPDNVTSIGGSAFWNCTSLTSITIPNSVKSISWGMFNNCTSLTSITIPKSVTEINSRAFYNCSSLTDVYYSGTKEEWNNLWISSSNNDPLTSAKIHYNDTVLPLQNISFTSTTVTKTYGDAAFTITAVNSTTDGGTITYSSDDESVAVVDEKTGEVTIKAAGQATITATAAEVEDKYAATSASYTLTVEKATPAGTPTYTKITSSGKTLADTALTGSFTNPKSGDTVEGTLSWDLDGTTTVEKNTAYTWTFTPNDTDNYNSVSGSLTPWYESSTPSTPTTPSTSSGIISGGVSGTTTSDSYTVTAPTVTGGSVTVTPSSASTGATVTLTVTPDDGYKLSTITVTDADGNEIELTKVSDTEYTFTMPSGNVTVTPAFVKSDSDSTDGSGETSQFTDISEGSYYYDAVMWAVEKGITTGTSDTTFSPSQSCTRAQMVTFLWRAAGSPAATGSNPFTDVTSDKYYYDAVLWAVEQGITTGTSDTTFSPDAKVTRAQTVTFLYRYAGSPAVSGDNPFTDVSGSTYYTDAVQWAVDNSITTGTSTTSFSPENDCTRAQIVTFLYRDLGE